MLTRQVMQWAQGIQGTDLAQPQLTWQHDGKQYTAVLTRRAAADNTDTDRAIIEIETVENGQRLRTQVQLKRLAFSHFTQLVDRWDTEVQLHDDEIAGRFHSNSEISLGYDSKAAPRFLGRVTTAAGGITLVSSTGSKRSDEIFRAGLETRAGRIALPERFQPYSSEHGARNVEVRSFSSDTRITFYSDGSYGWQPLGSSAPEQIEAVPAGPACIAAARDTSLHVRGNVRGTVVVYSPERIVIEGDLQYAHDPRTTPEASDYLALVSDKYVEVARPAVTGPGDLEIDAAVYARRRFIVRGEEAPGRARLIIYGSLTAGSLSATEPRYATKVEFDSRFEHQRPPGFPMTNRYEIETWDGKWQPAMDEPAQ